MSISVHENLLTHDGFSVASKTFECSSSSATQLSLTATILGHDLTTRSTFMASDRDIFFWDYSSLSKSKNID